MIAKERLELLPGRPSPLGASIRDGGVQFAVVSRHATAVWLALFEPGAEKPSIEYALEPDIHRLGDIWTVFVKGLAPSALYMYRMDGPKSPQFGHFYDASRYLVDPYAPGHRGKCGKRPNALRGSRTPG